MTAGRPPRWNVFADSAPDTWSDVASITSKDRLVLPVAVRRRIRWLAEAQAGGMLSKLEPNGAVELVGWERDGKAIVDDLTRRLSLLDEPSKSEFALALMDSFAWVSIDSSQRLALPPQLISYLDPDGRLAIRINVARDRLWLVNEAEWRTGHLKRLAAFDAMSVGD